MSGTRHDFADIKLRDGNLRAKFDVIIHPRVGGSAQSHVAGLIKSGDTPLPYKKSTATPNLGATDMLLSGTLANGEALANRAQLVDGAPSCLLLPNTGSSCFCVGDLSGSCRSVRRPGRSADIRADPRYRRFVQEFTEQPYRPEGHSVLGLAVGGDAG